MSRLTDLGIRRAKAKSSVYTLSDGRGLGLRIEPSGAKRWHFRFYWQNKQQRISFGYFPEVDLCLARERRESARELLARGVDPRSVGWDSYAIEQWIEERLSQPKEFD